MKAVIFGAVVIGGIAVLSAYIGADNGKPYGYREVLRGAANPPRSKRAEARIRVLDRLRELGADVNQTLDTDAL